MLLKDKVTLITPVRIVDKLNWDYFKHTITSYYSLFGDDKPKHLLAMAGAPVYKKAMVDLMNEVNPGGWVNVSPDTPPIKALNDLVRAVETPYTHVVLSDMCAIGTKNFLLPGIEAMEMDRDICQMRYGDDPLSCSLPTNLSSFESDGERVFFKGMPQFPFDPFMVASKIPQDGGIIHLYDNVVWRYPMAAAAQVKFIGFALWPCTYRTDIFKRVVDVAEGRTPPSARTLADWMAVVNHRPDFVHWCLPEKGWPEGFEFLEPLKQGTLNMACYIGALGRERKPWDQFLKVSTIELKSVPPAGVM